MEKGKNPDRSIPRGTFRFKQFSVRQERSPMKIGTDGVLLGAWANLAGVGKALDIGSGTGLIALMVAQRNPHLEIHGIEIDFESFAEFRENAQNSPWKERIFPISGSIQDFAERVNTHYQHILTNPPFFSGGTLSANSKKNQARHSLYLPADDLLKAVKKLLAPEGRFSLILPTVEGLAFIENAKIHSLFCVRLTAVRSLAHKPVERLLLEFSHQPVALSRDALIIQNEGRNNYTEAYKRLTCDFYLGL